VPKNVIFQQNVTNSQPISIFFGLNESFRGVGTYGKQVLRKKIFLKWGQKIEKMKNLKFAKFEKSHFSTKLGEFSTDFYNFFLFESFHGGSRYGIINF